MNLQQLRLLASVIRHDLNIGAAAATLKTSQPALSKQLRHLEDELGFAIFYRRGRSLTGVTRPGERVIESARRILREVRNVNFLGEDFKDASRGELAIGTTHTQARYVLPLVVQRFRVRYPNVQVHLHQGSVEQIARMSELGQVEFTLTADPRLLLAHTVQLPCFQWRMRVVAPRSHPLGEFPEVSLPQLAEHPLIIDEVEGDAADSTQQIFSRAGLNPKIILTARDGGVIKTYVRMGFGVGILAGVEIDPAVDSDLVVLPTPAAFPGYTTWIGFSRGSFLRGFMYDFIELLAPHLTRPQVDRSMHHGSADAVAAQFSHLPLPVR